MKIALDIISGPAMTAFALEVMGALATATGDSIAGIVGGFAVPISVFTKGVNSYYTYTMDKLSPVREYIDSIPPVTDTL